MLNAKKNRYFTGLPPVANIVLYFVLCLLLACDPNGELEPTQEPIVLAKVDLVAEETAADELLKSGIKFTFTMNSKGSTDDSGGYIGHSYISSDGVDIHTGEARYRNSPNATGCFTNYIQQGKEILRNEIVVNRKEIDGGQRVIGISDEHGNFFVAVLSGKLCRRYGSTSLPHLLAFEKWKEL